MVSFPSGPATELTVSFPSDLATELTVSFPSDLDTELTVSFPSGLVTELTVIPIHSLTLPSFMQWGTVDAEIKVLLC